jgi:glutathione peroxidase
MKHPIIQLFVAALAFTGLVPASQADPSQGVEALDIEMPTLLGQSINLKEAYLGKVILIVNTASECGFTSQYEGLQEIYTRYKDRGFVVLGFPSNDFGNQEPGSAKEIANFCRVNYGVEFPMFAKIHVKGEKASPLYKWLSEASGSTPKWNFHKYLIDREGRMVDYYTSLTTPTSSKLTKVIEGLL